MQRREEIRELIAEIASVHIEGVSTAIEIRVIDAMRELLAHIDVLEQAAAERVIADGSRGLVEALAVVVPEMDAPTICGLIETYVDDPREIDGVSTAQAVMRWFRENSRVIPADRVLGEGIVAVEREEWAATQDLLAQARCAAHAVEDEGQCDMTGICRAVFACDSLRANQGGVAT